MFNNSSNPWMLAEQTSAPEFANILSCYRWYAQNSTISTAQANEACSMHEDLARLGTETGIVFLLMGLLIIIPNAVVLLGIIGTRELRRPIYFFLANLAMADLFAGIGFVYRTVEDVGHNVMYEVILNYFSFIILAQMTSASALSLLSVNSYVGVRYPIYFHVHAHSAELRAVVAMTVSWIVLSLLAFSPSMGWNCVHMQTLATSICIGYCPLAFVILGASIVLLLCIVMLFTNISVFVAIRQREKRRLEQAGVPLGVSGGNGPVQSIEVSNNPPNNAAQEEAQRKYDARVYKARTVMIYVVVSFVFWLLPLLLVSVCKVFPDICPSNRGRALLAGFSLNSVINPLSTLIRTEDLRNAIWQKLTGIHQTLVTVMRGNRVDPQEGEAGTGGSPNLQEGSTHGQGQNTQSTSLAPEEQSAVGNRHYIIHNARMAGPDTSHRGQPRGPDLAMVDIG